MTIPVAGPIVVGIGDSAGYHYDSAMEFAAQEARRRRVGIKLVHGCEPLMTLTSLRPGPSLETRQRAAEQMLRAAARALRQKAGSTLDVDWSVQVGTGVQALLDESRTATMLVLQRRAVSAVGRAHTGSTTGRTASRAVCPVAVVRAGHTDSADRSGIVVGIDPEGSAEGALQQAVVEAELLKEPLIVVEAWSDPREATFDWVAYEPEELRARQERARLDLSESLAGLRSDHPDLEIRTEVVDGELTEGLLEASRHGSTSGGEPASDRSCRLAGAGRSRLAVHPQPRTAPSWSLLPPSTTAIRAGGRSTRRLDLPTEPLRGDSPQAKT